MSVNYSVPNAFDNVNILCRDHECKSTKNSLFTFAKMNKGKVTKRQGSKPNINNEPNEVFVLPPNLLEKLGINLGSVGSTPELSMDHLVSDKKTISKDIDIGQKQHIALNTSENYVKSPSQNESSIIETANLMKESLFLSPTFISNNTCAIQGEVEIVGNANLKNTRIADMNKHNNDDYSVCSNKMREDVDLNTVNISVTEKDLQNPINTKTLAFNENLAKEDHSRNALNIVDNIENDTPIEDNADKSYAFNCGISNKGDIDKIDTLNSRDLLQECGKKQNKNKRISIISEKILDPAQVKEWVSCASNRNNVVPVMVKTLVKSRCSKSVSHQNYVGLKLNPSFNENAINKESDQTKQNCVSFNFCIDEDIDNDNDTSVGCKSILSNDNYETLIEIEGTCPDAITKLSIDVVDEYKKEPDSSMDREDKTNKHKTGILHESSSNFFKSKSECKENVVNTTLDMVNSNVMNVLRFDKYNNRLKASTDVLPDVSMFEVTDKQNSKLTKDNEMCLKGTKITFSSEICQSDCITYEGLSQNEKNQFGFQFKQEDNEIKNKIKQSEQISHIKPDNETKIVENESKTVALHKSASFDSHNIKEQHDGQKNKAEVHKHDKPQAKVPTATMGTFHEMRSHNDTKFVQVENASAIQEDRVREIAKYLSQFADMQRRKSVDEKHNRKQGNHSKLSIQGVEKPGGTKSNNCYRNSHFNNLKTYVRKQKITPTIKSNQIESNGSQKFYLYDKKIDLGIQTDKSLVSLCYEHEFCLCEDFGRLVSYDNCCQYEHIHFWKENSIECTRDVVFSIYDEGVLVNTSELKETDMAIDDSKYISNAIPTCTDRKLCWNEINASGNKSPVREYKCDEAIEISFSKSTNKHSLDEEIPTETAVCNGIESTSNKIQRDNKNLTIDPVVNSSTCNKVIFDSDEDPTRNGKKRKWSTHLNECEETPGKKIGRANSILESDKSDKITKAPGIAEDEHVVPALPDVGTGIGQPSTLSSKGSISTCGVCRRDIRDTDWLQHIASEHNYMCWKVGQLALDLDNREMVVQHLSTIVKQIGELHCNKCGLTRKYAKAFLHHIKQCDKVSQNESTLNSSDKLNAAVVESVKQEIGSTSNFATENEAASVDKCIKCGVCGESMLDKDWSSHIEAQHNYLAWKCGEPILDLDNDDAVKDHLNAITKQCGGLRCSKCGRVRKYVKSYLTHFKNCDGLSESFNESALNVTSDLPEFKSERPVRVLVSDVNDETAASVDDAVTKCGVCQETMPSEHWNSHIELKHDYLAWKCGTQALDIYDEEAVKDHLYDITKECGGLKCSKCGLTRKYVKSYLTHFKSCNGPSESLNKSDLNISTDVVSVFESAKQERDSGSSVHDKTVTAPVGDGPSKCGVCGEHVEDKEWNSHLEVRHNYLAWKFGEPVLDVGDENAVKEHLHAIAKECGGLKCTKCGLQRKYVKSYLTHINGCNGLESEDENSFMKPEPGLTEAQRGAQEWSACAGPAECGVCGEEVAPGGWIPHIADKHDYLAWKNGEPSLNIHKKKEVYQHLCNIIKQSGALYCKKCGKKRKVVKNYLDHIKLCDQDVFTTNETTFEADSTLDLTDSCIDFDSGGACGVCRSEVEPGKWIQHTQKHHNYLAWRRDEKPWDLDDFTEVSENLYAVAKKMGGLTCNKCGLVRKYVKSYLTHIKNCSVIDFNINSTLSEGIGPVSDQANYRCAMCQEEVKPSKWKDHAMKKHYNITWVIGETPIDLKNPYAIERYLKEYRQASNNLQCHNCGATRASYAGFYAHIITCGKTEEQTEMFKSVCEICNNKYLCIYKNQHMMIHRVQDHSKELKLKKDGKIAIREEEEVNVSGKRRAAQKARSVIENYNNDLSQHPYKCESCGFGSDYKDELQSHTCDKSNDNEFSGDDSSEADVGESDDESLESEVNSDISMVENEEPKKKGQDRIRIPGPVSLKVSRLSFKVKKPQAYLLESDQDFCNEYLTDDTLFPQWQSCEREVVCENELMKYLPSMENSCKVKSGFDWTTLNKFEVKAGDGQVIFVGGCIISLTWVPLRVGDASNDHNFLAVACHKGVDSPRFQCDETPRHESLIQIWDFGVCKGLPKIVYGIAHNLGTVWSVDWCPSGARDILQENLEDGKICRLGLLAAACSSGSVYIFSVPYPASVVKDNKFVEKLKPVAELRMTMTSDRKLYQATSVTWSRQKGHSIVLVGYGDGSLAYYDLNCASPLLKTVEDDVEVFYPYYDERPHNSCVLGTDLFPAACAAGAAGAACSTGVTGAELAAGAARVRSQLAGHAAAFAPHWPGVMLAGDVTIMNTAMNELEWTAPARRLGGVRALAGCARCGLLATAAPPALRALRPHPAYPDYRKQVVGTLEMTPLGSKRKKQVNDELGMKLEPITYDDAIAKYGIEFTTIKKNDKQAQHQGGTKPRTHCPDRFPLADVTSMAFCPSKKHHDRLAIATHAGLIFFMKVDT